MTIILLNMQFLFLTCMWLRFQNVKMQKAKWHTAGAASEGGTDCFELS
jgi:hypothetical protein